MSEAKRDFYGDLVGPARQPEQLRAASGEALSALVTTWREAIVKLKAGIEDSPSHDLKRMIKERAEAFTICADELERVLKESGLTEALEAFEHITDALEECAVLLCEVHIRFGEPKIMTDDFKKEGEFTFKQAGQMYEEQAKRARGILKADR